MSTLPTLSLSIRRSIEPFDRTAINGVLEATGFFNDEELATAMELVDDALVNGSASHYRFLIAELNGRVSGYACWGPIPGTADAVDLYWIAVDPAAQGHGLGRALLAAAESWTHDSDRHRIYVETSSRPQYGPTRGFYVACGYRVVAELQDFYAPRDAKVIFLKVLGSDSP